VDTIGSMGCVHTHEGMYAIERWGNLSHVRNVVQKNREDNRKARKISQAISQKPIPGPEHDEIWARWALDVLLESMLETV
jgi:hypothetical protein